MCSPCLEEGGFGQSHQPPRRGNDQGVGLPLTTTKETVRNQAITFPPHSAGRWPLRTTAKLAVPAGRLAGRRSGGSRLPGAGVGGVGGCSQLSQELRGYLWALNPELCF